MRLVSCSISPAPCLAWPAPSADRNKQPPRPRSKSTPPKSSCSVASSFSSLLFFHSKTLPGLFASLLCFVATNSPLPVGWFHLAALYPALIASASNIYLPFFVLPYQRV